MGIANWVRRLLGRTGTMVPCALCRCDIPASHLERGLAVVIARQTYCRGCVEEITLRAKTPGFTFIADVGSSSTIYLR